MECMNCGEKGHSFRGCQKPIMSFGVACFIKNRQLKIPKAKHKPDDWLCICIRRRHTYAYVEYIRGKYRARDESYLKTLFKQMTTNEKTDIFTKKFDILWSELWLENEFPNNKIQSQKYKEQSREKHHYVLRHWRSRLFAKSGGWMEAEWGLPKGRRNLTEHYQETSLREFSEETGISCQSICLIDPEYSICEDYTATNGSHYRNSYLLAYWSDSRKLDLDEVQKSNIDSYSFRAEVSEVQAFSLTEILEHLRFYEKWKQFLFRQCFSVIHIRDYGRSDKSGTRFVRDIGASRSWGRSKISGRKGIRYCS